MQHKIFNRIITLGTLLIMILMTVDAQALELPQIFASQMVFQRDMPIQVWGKAKPGSKIVVGFAGNSVTTQTQRDGQWKLKLPAQKANAKDQTLTVTGDGTTLTFKNILIGEVWLCSGQSNMQWIVRNSNNAKQQIKSATDRLLRLCTVKKTVAQVPQDDASIRWEMSSPKTVDRFSAVAYFFGRYLRQELKIPVGLIHSSWGGTPAEAWTSQKAMLANDITKVAFDRWEKRMANYPKKLADWQVAYDKWKVAGNATKPFHDDPGNIGYGKGYAAPAFDDAAWQTIKLPALWDNTFDGVAWYRKTIQLPPAMRGKTLTINFPPIDDFDITYVNGSEIGQMIQPDAWSTPRHYTLPDWMTDTDMLTLAVRVFDRYGAGGLTGNASEMSITTSDSDQVISLAGSWKWIVEKRLPNAPGEVHGAPRKPQGANSPYRPASLYNAMIHPLIPYSIRGAIWYQGESNAGRAKEYRTLLPMMINNWRTDWQQGDFPFGIVQLANFRATSPNPSDPSWAHLRDAQRNTSLILPNVGQAVIIDIGEADNIHPKNKQDVGKRLGYWALNKVYGKKSVLPSGPKFVSHTIAGNKVKLTFDVVGNGLKTTDGKAPAEFIITNNMKTWHWAKAKITSKNTVTVWSDKVSKPVAVRYAWSNNPANPNLTHSANIPASPFRTDDEPQ